MPDNKKMELLEEALEIDRPGPKEAALLASRRPTNAPSELYHYTTDAGLSGLLACSVAHENTVH